MLKDLVTSTVAKIVWYTDWIMYHRVSTPSTAKPALRFPFLPQREVKRAHIPASGREKSRI